MTEKVYRIISTKGTYGLQSTGGTNPSFRNSGKIWTKKKFSPASSFSAMSEGAKGI